MGRRITSFGWALCLTLAACAPPAPAVPTSLAGKLESLKRATVTLLVLKQWYWGADVHSSEATGSGFFVRTARGPAIVTAAHVVAGATEIVAVDASGRRGRVTALYALDPEADLAIMACEGCESAQAVPLGVAPDVGAELVLISSPLGLEQTVAFGTMAARRPEVGAFQLAAAVSPGSSGGLVADAAGRAVGVIRSKASMESGGENITLATPADRVAASLKKLERRPLLPAPDARHMELSDVARIVTEPAEGARGPAGYGHLVVEVDGTTAEHMCIESKDPKSMLVIRAAGADEGAWSAPGQPRTCATVVGPVALELGVATRRARERVELRIYRQAEEEKTP